MIATPTMYLIYWERQVPDKSEIDAAMGRPSNYHTGNTNPVPAPASAATAPTKAPAEENADTFYEHVKSFFTKKPSEPTHVVDGKPMGINEIVDQAVAGAPKHAEE
jgi:hypothetical protein